MLFQPSNISPDQINGSGTVDLNENLNITWQVNGDSPMAAYQIVFYANDAASTLLYDTGKVTLDEPFWGVDYAGQTQYFTATIPAATLNTQNMKNGGEYKYIITQWWSQTESVQQSTASVMLGRSSPSVEINNITNPITSYTFFFTGVYKQAEGDALEWLRWRICSKDEDGNREAPFLDTGRIYGTGELRVSYSGFLNNTDYSIILDIQTANGQTATSGWVDFSAQYTVSSAQGSAKACLTADGNALITWSQITATKGYDIFRRTVGKHNLEKIGTVSNTVGELRDWSVCAGKSYVWYIFPTGPLAYLSEPTATNELPVQFWQWSILEAALNSYGSYSMLNSYVFRYGRNGVAEGQFSNNNSPTLQHNFTPYPTRQPTAVNYLTGSVSGFIGAINSRKEYADTLDMARALRNISVSPNSLFLRDPKGHLLNIHTNQAVTISIDHKSPTMPQTATIQWAELGEAENVKIISSPEGSFRPTDEVVFTTITVDPATGELIWTTEDDYSLGSVLSLDEGKLIQTVGEGFMEANMVIDGNTLYATVGD